MGRGESGRRTGNGNNRNHFHPVSLNPGSQKKARTPKQSIETRHNHPGLVYCASFIMMNSDKVGEPDKSIKGQ